jgi:hypothetical protein
MVNILEAQQQENKELLNKVSELEKLLVNKDKEVNELKAKLNVNENTILTEEEIREIVSSLNKNPDEEHTRAVKDYF